MQEWFYAIFDLQQYLVGDWILIENKAPKLSDPNARQIFVNELFESSPFNIARMGEAIAYQTVGNDTLSFEKKLYISFKNFTPWRNF